MMINLNVKIKGGKRTPIEVTVYDTAVNQKELVFKNGNRIKGGDIAEMLEKNLTAALKSIQEAI